jgi:hypothetical protein
VEKLQSASRAELSETILRQQLEMAVLLEQVESLVVRVAELEEEVRRLRRGQTGGTAFVVKPSRPAREKRERKRRDGSFVRRKETPDEVRYHALECCPDCGWKLEGGWEHRRRQTIEVTVQLKVVDHVMLARRCGVCGKRWLPKLSDEVIGVQGKRRFGVSVQGLVATLSARYLEAKAFPHPSARLRRQQRRRFERLAARLARPYINDPEAPQRTLAQRIMKHRHELFVFVSHPAAPADNNLAERSLRPAVVARKISGGARSPKGSDTKMGLMSLFGTWQVQGKPLLSTCRELLTTP